MDRRGQGVSPSGGQNRVPVPGASPATETWTDGPSRLGVHELAHDLDNELALLSLMLGPEGPGGGPSDVRTRMRSAQDQLQTARDVLQAAVYPGVRDVVHLTATVADVLAALRVAHAGDLQLLPGPDCTVHGDAMLVRRAVSNLARNACAAAPHGRVQVAVTSDAVATTVVVEDDGSGGSAALGPGLGFGLGIVEAVAAAHGGALTVSRSELGGWRAAMVLPDLGEPS